MKAQCEPPAVPGAADAEAGGEGRRRRACAREGPHAGTLDVRMHTAARQAGFGVALALQGFLTLVMQARYVCACTAARHAGFGIARALQGSPPPLSSEPLTQPEAQVTDLRQLSHSSMCQCHTPQMRM